MAGSGFAPHFATPVRGLSKLYCAPAPPRTSMIGTRLGQYRIDALLGQGGMGAVYLATDEMLGRQVAIKVLRDDVDTQGTATERFRSEAQILARLDHPQILRLYGFSQHDGVLYMVTEFVRQLEATSFAESLMVVVVGSFVDGELVEFDEARDAHLFRMRQEWSSDDVHRLRAKRSRPSDP